MAEKTKQHYVPRFYLKNFAEGKVFNIYNSKHHSIMNDVPFASQCYKNNFYGKDKIYENELSVLETKWSSAIKNVILNSNSITKEDETLLKQFCCFQHVRTEKAFLHTRNAFFDMARQLFTIDLRHKGITATEQEINAYAYKYSKDLESIEDTTKRQIDIAKECYEKLDNLQILIIENKTDLEFITSDNPIVIGNEFQNEHGLGMDCIGIYFLFPISSQLYICLFDNKIYSNIRDKNKLEISRNIVEKLNILQYQNSLENIFSISNNGVEFIIKYVDKRCDEIRKSLLNKYNKTHNNFLSQNQKAFTNTLFANLLANISNKTISLICKGKPENIYLEFFKINENARPFQNKLNYNFHRSATEKEVNDRISFMLSCHNPNIEFPLKEKLNANKQEYELVCLWADFLKNYFDLS